MYWLIVSEGLALKIKRKNNEMGFDRPQTLILLLFSWVFERMWYKLGHELKVLDRTTDKKWESKMSWMLDFPGHETIVWILSTAFAPISLPCQSNQGCRKCHPLDLITVSLNYIYLCNWRKIPAKLIRELQISNDKTEAQQ